MALGNREILQPDCRVDVAFQLAQQFARAGMDAAPINGAKPCTRRMAKKDVFTDRQLVKQNGFLMNGGHAGIDCGLRTWKRDRLPIDEDLTLVRPIDAGQDLDERRFSGPVFTDQRSDLPWVKADRHLVERLHARKYLADATHFQNGGSGQWRNLGHRCDSIHC